MRKRGVENTSGHWLFGTPGVYVLTKANNYVSLHSRSYSRYIAHATMGKINDCVQCSTCNSGTIQSGTAGVRCVSVGGLGSWTWKRLELKKKMVAHRP